MGTDIVRNLAVSFCLKLQAETVWQNTFRLEKCFNQMVANEEALFPLNCMWKDKILSLNVIHRNGLSHRPQINR